MNMCESLCVAIGYCCLLVYLFQQLLGHLRQLLEDLRLPPAHEEQEEDVAPRGGGWGSGGGRKVQVGYFGGG